MYSQMRVIVYTLCVIASVCTRACDVRKANPIRRYRLTCSLDQIPEG